MRVAYVKLAANIAQRLNFGPLSQMPPGLRQRVRSEVADAVADWQIAEARDPPARPTTELQKLLAAFSNLKRALPDQPEDGSSTES